jgi:hypothetical protein
LVNIVGDAEIRGLLMRPQECGEPSVRIASTAAPKFLVIRLVAKRAGIGA